jgi:hypothetical protein
MSKTVKSILNLLIQGDLMKTFIFASLLFAIPSFAQVTLAGLEYQGSGCPQGHVSVTLAPDGSAFSVLYDSFNLTVGDQIAQAKSTCSIAIHLKKPKKSGFRVEAADFRGFVALDSGVTATQNVQVMSGPNHGHQQLSAEFGTQVWSGPMSEDYTLRAVHPVNNKPPVLDCVPPKENTDIVINSQVQISGGGNSRFGQVTVDSVDGLIVQKFSLTWLDCKK